MRVGMCRFDRELLPMSRDLKLDTGYPGMVDFLKNIFSYSVLFLVSSVSGSVFSTEMDTTWTELQFASEFLKEY